MIMNIKQRKTKIEPSRGGSKIFKRVVADTNRPPNNMLIKLNCPLVCPQNVAI